MSYHNRNVPILSTPMRNWDQTTTLRPNFFAKAMQRRRLRDSENPLEVRVQRCRLQGRVPGQFLQRVARNSIGLEYRDHPIRKCIKAGWFQIQTLQNLIELAPHINFCGKVCGGESRTRSLVCVHLVLRALMLGTRLQARQIDAIADNQLSHPFSDTQCMLVEAKCTPRRLDRKSFAMRLVGEIQRGVLESRRLLP